IDYDCIPCIYRKVLESSRMVTDDDKLIRQIINKFAEMIPEIKSEESAPMIVGIIQGYLKEITGEIDPYYQFKEKNTRNALNIYDDVKQIVKGHQDHLQGALIMSAMGNSIDAGVSLVVDIEENIDRAIESGFTYSDYDVFQNKITTARNILIIADNTGEAVFDRLLIEELNKYKLDVTYAVRDQAILNDITIKEARDIGVDRLCRLISSGCDTPGLILDRANKEFIDIYSKADIIVSKGQGNLEGLLGIAKKTFFLLKIKCDIVARRLGSGLKTGDFIFIYI
ncbi:MAG: damage-control phosphatase ARMT1 family protein, partial [Halanaerobiales bacterium]